MSSYDIAAADTRYAPQKGMTTKISFTAVSSVWTQLNSLPNPRYFTFSCTQNCYLVCGPSNMAAAANTDFLLPAGIHDFIVLPGYGIRVISDGADGVLCATPSGV